MAKKPTVKVQMADEVEDLPSPQEVLTPLTVPDAAHPEDDAFHFADPGTATNHTHTLTGLTTYQSRIRIVEAWRYPGSFKDAPEFIDRNWAAYAGYDDERKIEAGPCLRLPANTPTGEKLARRGDYVVRQEIQLASNLPGDIEVDVWPAEQFERLFIPVSEKPFRPFNPTETVALPTTPQDAAAPAADDAGPPPKADGVDSGNGDPHLSTRDGG
jgi:hypothetical protein